MPGMPGGGGGYGMLSRQGSSDTGHEMKNVDDVNESTPFAHQVLPIREAVIVASFPYRQQIEEFQRKLHLSDPTEVLNEMSEEVVDGVQEPSFRFEGVKVKRRTFDAGGKQLTDWEDMNLNEALKPLLVLTGATFQDVEEKISPEVEAITFPGLVMSRLPDFSDQNEEDKFPELEKKIPTLAKTLKEITDAEKVVAPKVTIFDTKGIDPFKRRKDRNAGAGATGQMPGMPGLPAKGVGPGRPGGGTPGAPLTPGMPGRPGVGGKGPGKPGGEEGRPGVGAPRMPGMPGMPGMPAGQSSGLIPEHCLVRVIDVTIEPGKQYEYQLQVVMANPNFKRIKDAASPAYAQQPRIEGKPYIVPNRVSVPPEAFFYAVDQKKVDQAASKKYQGLTQYDPPDRDRDGRPVWTMMQMQRWVADAGNTTLLGEWCVADRVPVYRGEYAGQKEKIEVPVWDTDQEKFILGTDANAPRGGRRSQTGKLINFNDENNPTIVVDFEGGVVSTPRATGKRLDEEAATEVLLLSDDGRLQLRNSAVDTADAARVKRLDEYHERIKKVKDSDQNTQPQQGPGGNPFGGKGTGPKS